jgi:NADH-quinone oxidoreductase subunit N
MVAVLSMAIGNITAIVQTNIKRMLAYSTISHMGFLLVGFLVGNAEGYSSAMYYAIIYVLMSMAAFGILLALSRAGFECEKISDLKGLNQRNSWYALLMLLTMFSMAGIPPLAGFYAKFAVIRAALDAQMVPLAVFAVVMSLIGAFYYLRVVRTMYFDDAEDQSAIVVRPEMKLTLSVNALALLALGVLPEGLISLCYDAIKQSLTLL